MNRSGNLMAVALAAALSFGAAAVSASPIVVFGPSPVAPFAGTVIDFEGFAEGTVISNQYAGLGVTFKQDDGGTPIIDDLPPLFGFGPGSGVGMLTGSTNGGAIVSDHCRSDCRVQFEHGRGRRVLLRHRATGIVHLHGLR